MSRASPVAPVVKDLPANAGATGDSGSVPGLGRAPGGEKTTHSSTLAWEIPLSEEPDVHGVTKNQT